MASEAYELASTLFASLLALGITDVVVSPGSRSTPLALAAQRLVPERVHVVLDERAAGFVALGLARTTGRPAVLVCTSGSAVGHYLPAVLEADLSEVPMIVLSADRPFELHRSGASQTLDQVKLFSDHVRDYFELGVPDEALVHAAPAIAARVVRAAWDGPVHVNVRFRKPLEPPPGFFAQPLASRRVPRVLRGQTGPSAAAVEALDAVVRERGAGVVVVGALPFEDGGLLAELEAAARRGHLVLAEPASGLPTDAELAPLWAGVRALPQPTWLVELGAPPVLAAYERWSAGASLRVGVGARTLVDPTGTVDLFVESEPALFVRDALRAPPSVHAARAATEEVRSRGAALLRAHARRGRLTEPGASFALAEALPDGAVLLLGNSLAIRDFGRYGHAAARRGVRIQHQRGHAGIDGLIAGAVGARLRARADAPVVVLLGDVSAAHDLGALSLLRDVRLPLVVVVLDNGGGRIFDRLPIATAELPDHAFARLYHTDPRGAAALAARGLGLRVAAPTTMEELDDALTDALAQPNATLLDVKIDPDADATLRQLLEAELRA